MEASSLKTKKQIQKGKLKKTMKNILCQPDSNFWPLTSENDGKALTEELNKLKVDIPDFKKPRWSEISQIPKESRPKPPPIPKVNGLIFGITECKKAIETKECIGILIDAEVNPKTIVQPLIDICLDKSVPILCLKELKTTTDTNFGISTSVLGVKQNLLPKLEKKFLEISKSHKSPNNDKEAQLPKIPIPVNYAQIMEVYNRLNGIPTGDMNVEMKTSNSDENDSEEEVWEQTLSPYVYRVAKSVRTFSPILYAKLRAEYSVFNLPHSIQKFQTAPTASTSSQPPYMKMTVKKISSNPNRKKVSKANSKD